jgi:hypothetical protein
MHGTTMEKSIGNIKKDLMVGTYITLDEKRINMVFWLRDLKEGINLEDLVVDGRIILKYKFCYTTGCSLVDKSRRFRVTC